MSRAAAGTTGGTPYLAEERTLLGSRSIRAYLQNYSPEQWPSVVKLLLLYGIASLQLEHDGPVLGLPELARRVGRRPAPQPELCPRPSALVTRPRGACAGEAELQLRTRRAAPGPESDGRRCSKAAGGDGAPGPSKRASLRSARCPSPAPHSPAAKSSRTSRAAATARVARSSPPPPMASLRHVASQGAQPRPLSGR
eukprot:scaffold4409_cov369-Prasinococcus_capsulatus_cf.AAC.23